MKKILYRREAPIIIFTLMVTVIFSLISKSFISVDNFDLILTQITTIGIVAIGMMMVILFGGIDLSVGSVLALVATVVGIMVNSGINIIICLLAGLLLGATCGAFNGFFITRFNIPDIIVTLATMFIFRGIAVGVSGGSWVTNFPDTFSYIGQGEILGISIPILLLVLAALLFGYILHQTRFGRRVYAIGGNPQAAKLSGMKTKKTKFLVYVYSGMLASVAAVTFAAKVGSVQASTAGLSLAFDVIAAVLIGGASIFGGIGTVLGTMFGVLLLGIIKNGLILVHASVYWIDATTGMLIILAIIINTIQRRREARVREGVLL